MKKFVYSAFFVVCLVGVLFPSCCKDTDETTPDPIKTFNIDTSYIPRTSILQKVWYGEYSGWDDVQKKNTTIRRTLVLNANGTYTNTIHGKLDASQDLIVFEAEKGTYSYNAMKGIISYTVQYDSLINYQNLQKTGYVKKHYYSVDGKNSNDKAIYTEKAQFTIADNTGKRQWVAKDTYLQQLTAQTLELYFLMDVKQIY